MILNAAKTVMDRVKMRRDASPEATFGLCGFTQADIDAAPRVVTVEPEDDDEVGLFATHPAFIGLTAELRSAGVKVEVVPGWKTRGRPGAFAPVGKMNHHTASNKDAGNHPALGIVTNGRSDLPGPLANFVAARDGTIIFVATGRCNHGGIGGPFRFIGTDAANAACFSVEIENNGIGEPYPARQKEAVAILNAAILERLKRGSWHSVGHKEYTSRKIDPSFDMPAFRDQVRRAIKRLRLKIWRVLARKDIPGRKRARAAAQRLRKRGWTVEVNERK